MQVLSDCRKTPGELERVGVPSNNNRSRRLERRRREDYCGGKSFFPEQKWFPCSFCGRNPQDSSKNWRGWQWRGTLVVRVGAGTMSAFIVSYGRIVRCIRRTQGAEQIDEAIVRLLREECGLGVGLEQAEALKKSLSGRLGERSEVASVVGLDRTTGFPVRREVSAGLVRRAFDPLSDAIVCMALEVLGQAPDELCADLLDSGIVLTGGGAHIAGLDALLREQCGLKCRAADSPENASSRALARVLRDEQLSELIDQAG